METIAAVDELVAKAERLWAEVGRDNGSGPRGTLLLALAWIEAVNRDYAWRGKVLEPYVVRECELAERLCFHVHAKSASDKPERWITANPGTPPVYALAPSMADPLQRLPAVCLDSIMGAVAPLWVHYLPLAREMIKIMDEGTKP